MNVVFKAQIKTSHDDHEGNYWVDADRKYAIVHHFKLPANQHFFRVGTQQFGPVNLLVDDSAFEILPNDKI